MKSRSLFFVVPLVLVLLLFGCVSSSQPTTTPTHHVVNHTASINKTTPQSNNSSILSSGKVAKYGDIVTFDYTIYINKSGNLTLYDTTNATLGHKWGLNKTKYAPITILLKPNAQMLPAIIHALLGMKVNQTSSFSLPASMAFGNPNPDLIYKVQASETLPKYDTEPYAFFYANNINPNNLTVNQTITLPPFTARVVNITNKSITFEYILGLHQLVVYDHCLRVCMNITNQSYVLACSFDKYKVLPDGRKQYIFEFNNKWGFYFIDNITNNTIYVDGNPPLAGKDLYIILHVDKIYEVHAS